MVFVTEDVVNKIKSEGEKNYPHECCGIMYGEVIYDKITVKSVDFVKPIENSFDESEKYHRFMITAEDMMKAEMYARKNKIEIVGFYHSHTDCEAIASEYDREHALPIYSYIIVSVIDGKAVDMQSWELDVSEANSVFNSEKLMLKENV